MRCTWSRLAAILPPEFSRQLEATDREAAQEIRLRVNAPPEINLGKTWRQLSGTVSQENLTRIINLASKYSPWCAETLSQGYLTAPGGHRIGICGSIIVGRGQRDSLQRVRSVCIRIARDFPGIAGRIKEGAESTLIVGAPGWGKTTLLRDLARQIAARETVSVVDERGELFPDGFEPGVRMDILTGVPKPQGIEMVLKTMGPAYIAVDEITAEADCRALIHAANCGVRLLATAHGTGVQDLTERSVYRPLLERRIFGRILVLDKNQSYRTERVRLCGQNGLERC